MKKLYTLTFITFLSFNPCIFGQQIIVEEKKTVGETKAFHQNQKVKQTAEVFHLDEQTELFFKPDTESLSGVNHPEAINDVHTVTINLIYISGTYSPMSVILFDEGENYFNEFSGETNSITFTNVPSGTYDIVTQSREDVTFKQSYVIKEQLTINSDSEFDINLNEADNLMTVKLLNENGEDLKPGIMDPDTGEVTGGTAEVYGTTYVYFHPKEWTPFISYYLWENSQGVVDEIWNFYLSDVSDRYSFIHTNIALGYNGEGYASKYDIITNVNSSITLQNEPDEWVSHEEKFQSSILGENQGGFYHVLSSWDAYEGNGLSGWGSLIFSQEVSVDDVFRVNLNTPMNDNPVDVVLYPGLEDYYGLFDPSYMDESFQISGNALILNEQNEVQYGSKGFTTNFYGTGYNYNIDSEGHVKILPYHPKFEFNAIENHNLVLGRTAPFGITSYNGSFFAISYFGNGGEGRDSDIMDVGVEIVKDGSMIFEGTYSEYFFSDPLEEGLLEISFQNQNTLIEEVPSSTITKLKVNAENESDNIPPTIQMLQFRNDDGKVTSIFDSAGEGRVRIAAADFSYNPEFRSFDYKPENTITFFYRKHDQEGWDEMELTSYPEHLFPIGYGDYYEASLESISEIENDAWYDVKIVCADTEGNMQEQIIAPAFKLNNTMNILEQETTDVLVYPNPFSDKLTIITNSSNSSIFLKVSDMSGKVFHAEERKADASIIWDGSYLPKGIYILTIEQNGKISSKKIIKK